MEHERRKGLVYSAALHLSLLLLAVFGLPSFLQREIAPQPMVIAVELLPISAMTNVKTSDLPLAQVEKPVPQEEEKKPTPPVKAEEPPPPPPPEKKPEEKKEHKHKNNGKEEKKEKNKEEGRTKAKRKRKKKRSPRKTTLRRC